MVLHARKSLLILAALLFASPSAFGLILYPGDAGATNKPADDVLGRWSSNATCVSIGKDLVLTTRHQGGGVGSVVNIGGANYTVSQEWAEPNNADIRVDKLSGAHLSDYVSIYSGSNELGMTVTIGGFGLGRGTTLNDGNGVAYGYDWDFTAGNSIERWGNNVIIDTYVNDSGTHAVADTFSSPWGGYKIDHECAIADYDSGCGWLYQSGSTWYVVALGRAVTHFGASWFRDPNDPQGATDENEAVEVSAYASWIQTVPEPATLTLLALGGAILLRRRRR